MIKLLWNTHNQENTLTDDIHLKKELFINNKWGLYHKENSDKWIYEILKKIKYTSISDIKNLQDVIIIYL